MCICPPLLKGKKKKCNTQTECINFMTLTFELHTDSLQELMIWTFDIFTSKPTCIYNGFDVNGHCMQNQNQNLFLRNCLENKTLRVTD